MTPPKDDSVKLEGLIEDLLAMRDEDTLKRAEIRTLEEAAQALQSALLRERELEAALEPFAAIAPSSLYPEDGSEDEGYIVLLKSHYDNPKAFSGVDLARARSSLKGEG